MINVLPFLELSEKARNLVIFQKYLSMHHDRTTVGQIFQENHQEEGLITLLITSLYSITIKESLINGAQKRHSSVQ